MNCICYEWKMECHGWISSMNDYVYNDDVEWCWQWSSHAITWIILIELF
jgi:hypothetical protein